MHFRQVGRALRHCRLLGALLSLVLVTLAPASTLAADNPIVLENQQPGTNSWLFLTQGSDGAGQIKGYASATSVNQNENITFYVTVNPAQTFSIDFYRFGWYGGAGGRIRLHVGPIDAVQQPPCQSDSSTGLLQCNWTPSYTLNVPSDWTSGIYAAKLTNAQGYQNYVTFVVKDGRPASFLYQQGIATDQAYNNYPDDGSTGKSLYGYNSYGANTISGNTSAVKVSFDRPMANGGIGLLINWEINLIRWLEKNGYDVTYTTDLDTHVNAAELLRHKAFFSTGHDEYWSKEMRDAVEAARDAGVHLAFFGANAVYTQVRFESSGTGAPNRVMVEYRNAPWNPIDPVQGPTTTTNFRDPPVSRPEQTLLGIQFIGSMPNTDYVVTNSSHWMYAGTGFHDGDVVPGIVGYEADSFMTNYAGPNSSNHTLLSHSPFLDGSVTKYANSSIYRAPSRAWVFAAGTMSWSWALDDVPGLGHGRVDARIQQATANLLNVFLNGLPPAITGVTPGSGSAGTSVTISGANFTGATSVRFNGTAAAFSVTSDTAIQATVPAAATTGPLTVTTPDGTATSATNFVAAPTITSFTPANGPVGTVVTISGTNFTAATAVKFNGTSATSFTVTSATTIQATVPTGATTGAVSVTTSAGIGTSATNFTVTAVLTVQKTSGPLGLGTGTVTSSPAGINCGPGCSASYSLGTSVVLTAVPEGISIFNGWTGCDATNGASCTVAVSKAKTVVVNFLP